MMTYIRPLGQPLYKKSEYQYKNKTRITHQTKKCKNCPIQEYYSKTQRYRTISDHGNISKIKIQRKMKTKEAQKNLQNTLKNSRTTICKHKTKHTLNRIYNNKIKTSKILNSNYTQYNTI